MITGCNEVHACPVARTCSYLEWMGAIKSARAIYIGEKELAVDESKFESSG
jgi:hypothetical protein